MSLLSKIKNKLFKTEKVRHFELERPKYIDRHKNKDFLIIATGPSMKNELPKVEKFIQDKQPIVMVSNRSIMKSLVNYHIFVNRRRFVDYGASSLSEANLIISPSFPNHTVKKIIKNRAFEYVMFKNNAKSDHGSFKMDEDFIPHIEGGTVVTIAAGLAIAMGAKNIFLAGVDGYSKSNSENTHYYKEADNKEIKDLLLQEKVHNEIFKDIRKEVEKNGGKFGIITPTAYSDFQL